MPTPIAERNPGLHEKNQLKRGWKASCEILQKRIDDQGAILAEKNSNKAITDKYLRKEEQKVLKYLKELSKKIQEEFKKLHSQEEKKKCLAVINSVNSFMEVHQLDSELNGSETQNAEKVRVMGDMLSQAEFFNNKNSVILKIAGASVLITVGLSLPLAPLLPVLLIAGFAAGAGFLVGGLGVPLVVVIALGLILYASIKIASEVPKLAIKDEIGIHDLAKAVHNFNYENALKPKASTSSFFNNPTPEKSAKESEIDYSPSPGDYGKVMG